MPASLPPHADSHVVPAPAATLANTALPIAIRTLRIFASHLTLSPNARPVTRVRKTMGGYGPPGRQRRQGIGGAHRGGHVLFAPPSLLPWCPWRPGGLSPLCDEVLGDLVELVACREDAVADLSRHSRELRQRVRARPESNDPGRRVGQRKAH